MQIGNILKETQSEEYKRIKMKYRHSKPKKKIELNEYEIKELMSHSSYKRKGRALRQVR